MNMCETQASRWIPFNSTTMDVLGINSKFITFISVSDRRNS